MKVFISGVAGLLGSNVANHLLNQGIKVVGVVRGLSVAFRITLNLLMTFRGLLSLVISLLISKDACRMQGSGIWNGI